MSTPFAAMRSKKSDTPRNRLMPPMISSLFDRFQMAAAAMRWWLSERRRGGQLQTAHANIT